MNNKEIKVSVKDIPEVIEQLQQAEEKINNLQSKIGKAIDKLNQYEIISGYYDSNYDDIEDTYSHDIKEDLLDILKEVE